MLVNSGVVSSTVIVCVADVLLPASSGRSERADNSVVANTVSNRCWTLQSSSRQSSKRLL